MDRKIHIFYRHVHSHADIRSRDPNKRRPEWFSYEACFRNLLSSIQGDALGDRVRLTLMFDGSVDDFMQDFSSGYYGNKSLNIGLQRIEAGSDLNSALITIHHVANSDLAPGDLVYMLENDYMHQPGWVSKVFELYEAAVKFDYLSLYDHRDKYFLSMYADLQARLFHTRTHHWRTAPSTCGSYLTEVATFHADVDILRQGLPDFHLFHALTQGRQRVLLTPVPGLSTHCMEGYLSPAVNWPAYLV